MTQTPPAIDVFRERCEALALLVRNDEMDVAEAADRLQNAAEGYGLVAELGQDAVQGIIAEAFNNSSASVGGFDEKAFSENCDAARARVEAEEKLANSHIKSKSDQHRPVIISTAEAIMSKTYAPVKYVVPGVFVEGLTLFAGKPKVGKSWFLLHAAVAVARGSFTLGEIKCPEGDALYCALEDNERRLQSRMRKLFGYDWPGTPRLTFRCEMPRLAEGGIAVIERWITSVPEPRLIIIDTLAMVRAPKKRDQSNYEADYAAGQELRALANRCGIAIVLVHHLRKADSDDPYDLISGTLGLTGVPDSVLVLRQDAKGYTLHGRGRDLMEIEKAMTFNTNDSCLWVILGNAGEVRQSNERGAILVAVEEAGEPLGPNEIATAIGAKAVNVRKLLAKLASEGRIEKVQYGKYALKRAAAA